MILHLYKITLTNAYGEQAVFHVASMKNGLHVGDCLALATKARDDAGVSKDFNRLSYMEFPEGDAPNKVYFDFNEAAAAFNETGMLP